MTNIADEFASRVNPVSINIETLQYLDSMIKSKNIASIQTTLADINANMRTKYKESNEYNQAKIKEVSDKLQSEHKELQTLTVNVKKLYDAYNESVN